MTALHDKCAVIFGICVRGQISSWQVFWRSMLLGYT